MTLAIVREKVRLVGIRKSIDASIAFAFEQILSSDRSTRVLDDLAALRDVVDLDIAHVDAELERLKIELRDRLATAASVHLRSEPVEPKFEQRTTLDPVPCRDCGGRESTCNCECGDHFCGCPCHTDDERHVCAALAVRADR